MDGEMGAMNNQVQRQIIPVDDWIPNEEDKIFTNAKNVIELNEISRIYNMPDHSPISFFIMSAKKGYNSSTKKEIDSNGQEKITIGYRDHCTTYLNYFEKYYDTERIVVGIFAQIKYLIDYQADTYFEEEFINDLFRYFIDYNGNVKLHDEIIRFVDDNYNIPLNYTNSKKPCLKYTDDHAKILMEISFVQNLLIPLIMHFAYVRKYGDDIRNILMRGFDLIINEAHMRYNVDIGAKLYETILSNVDRNIHGNPVLWDMQAIRARNNIVHSMATEENIIMQTLPRYCFSKNIICFNSSVIQMDIKYKVVRAPYEYNLTVVSSSNYDEDNNSEADKFEAHLTKVDEAMVIQTTVNCEQTIQRICNMYGPFSEEEIMFYMDELARGGKNIKNQFQVNLIYYLFLKEFKDVQAIKLVGFRDYVILMLAAKRYLISAGQSLFPYIIGGRVERLVSRKTVNKKILQKMQYSENYPKIQAKYQNKKIQEGIIFKIISQILASDFRNIDYYNPELNGVHIECIPEKISEEIQQYILLI